MKLKSMAVAGALAGLALVGCSSGSTSATTQTGTIVGTITDVDAQSFNVKPANGEEITLHRGAQAGNVNLQQGEEVRAAFRVDTDGNKVAQSVQVLSAGNSNGNNGSNP